MITLVPGGPFEELYLLKVIVGFLSYELRQCIIFSYLRLAVNYINFVILSSCLCHYINYYAVD